MSTRIAVALVLALSCTPTSGPTPPAPPAAAEVTRELPAELVGFVQPWHPLDRQLAESAPVWVLTRYEPGTYPCRLGPEGSLEMLIQDRFAVLQTIRGVVRAPGVDVDVHALRGPEFPRAYAEGRRYLLFLRPGPERQALLADAGALGSTRDRLGVDEVLAVIDLDASAAEASAEQVQATRRAGSWTPATWAALRAAAAPEPAHQRELAALLQSTITRPRASLADVRAWLGPPDSQHLLADGSRSDDYVLARPAYVAPVQGGLYGDLTLRYDARLELRVVELGYLRWRLEPRQQASMMLTADEHAKLGLPRLELQFR